MTGILLFLYDLLGSLASLCLLPFIPLQRSGPLADRLGLFRPLERAGTPSLWVHALSVGEVLSAVPLVLALRGRYSGIPLVFTATTAQGLSMARRELGGKVDRILRMPLDTCWSMRRLLDHIRPTLFIVVETDLWPGLLNRLAKRRIRAVLVNGRVSPRTYRTYRRFRFLVRNLLFGGLDRCLVQTEVDRERLLRIGLSPEKVVTAGNIKFDREWVSMTGEEADRLLKTLNLTPQDTLIVAGSIHPGEEEVLLNVFLRLRPLFPQTRLILAPRRIEDAESVHRSAAAKGLRPLLRTDLPGTSEHHDVLVLNTLGELGRIYGLGTITFVGGSLVPLGGHNVLEPAAFGKPVLFGPHMHNFQLMSQLLVETGGGRMVGDEEGLFSAMRQLLGDPHQRGSMGRSAREFVEGNRGALARVLDQIDACLKANPRDALA
ncbi:MAG: 3-deoxy-D-manno-octulosonic acid transferase [Thermodesulfobacteriota bacterium]